MSRGGFPGRVFPAVGGGEVKTPPRVPTGALTSAPPACCGGKALHALRSQLRPFRRPCCARRLDALERGVSVSDTPKSHGALHRARRGQAVPDCGLPQVRSRRHRAL